MRTASSLNCAFNRLIAGGERNPSRSLVVTMVVHARVRWSAVCLVLLTLGSFAQGQEARVGRFITLRGAVDSAMVQRTLGALREAHQASAKILVFDLQLGQSDFGTCYDLANSISQVGGSVERTVAYVSKPLAGNAVLVALACDEIVFAPGSSLGPLSLDADLKLREKSVFESIAAEKGHGKWVATGLAERGSTIIEYDTPAGRAIKTGQERDEFEKSTQVLRRQNLKEPGTSWVIDVDLAKRLGLIRLVCETRRDVAVAYELSEQSAADDSTFKEATKPAFLKVEGIINDRTYSALKRRLTDAQNRGCTLLFVEIESTSGETLAAGSLMDAIHRFPGYKVAYVPRAATGPATLVFLGCDELVVGPQAVVGDFQPDGDVRPLIEGAVEGSKESKYPQALVRGLLDPATEVMVVRGKANPALRGYKTAEELADPEVAGAWEVVRTAKAAGAVWKLESGAACRELDLAIAVVESREKLASLYGVSDSVPQLEATWVDAVVDGLTSSGATVFLLVLGLTCLYIEFQMPGFGIGGIISAVCFVLFFWARFLSETANSLEVVMFLLGLVLLALELFVFPGFGVMGITGLVLLFASLILASQNFPWPTSEGERRILMTNVLQLAASVGVFLGIAVTMARFFPTLPFMQRMMLQPPGVSSEEWNPEAIESEESELDQLIGQVGTSTSPLRPAGRIKLDGRYLDVITAGEFIEPGRAVEIVEVFSNRIIVRAANS